VVLRRPYYLALLAEVCGRTGRVDEGLDALTQALSLVEETGQRRWEAEIHRIRGELLLARSPEDRAEAEACFRQAVEVARGQGAKSLELRAALSLSRLWRDRGKRAEARDLLGPIHAWFTEGLDTADLKDAKVLLAELR
jgi:predicted ATPase